MNVKMLARLTLVGLFACVLSLFSQAQNKTITGKVTDAKDGSALAGASIVVKGSKLGSQTGADGTFKISVPTSTTTLIVSSVGYGSMNVDVQNKSSVEVSLAATSDNIGEVVVIGYGTSRKKDLTGAVTSIKAKDFNQGPINAPDQLIQGKVAGVQITNNSGQPGGATTIRIRGNSSVRSGNSPLFVIDGIPLDGRNARPGLNASGIGQTPDANPLYFYNPADIASMDVLKDASATAIYGSRGANGVVMITTKKGQAGVTKIDFSTSVGTASVRKKYSVLDAAGYKAALTSYGITGDQGLSVDAQDAIFRNATSQNYNLGISGGNENGKYRFSLGYSDQNGIVLKSNLKKYNIGLNGQYKFLESKRLSLDFNILAAHNTEIGVPVTNDAGFQGNLVGMALQWNPTKALYKADGSINITPGESVVNPLAMSAGYNDQADITNIFATVGLGYKLSADLDYKFNFSLNNQTGVRRASEQPYITIPGIEGSGFGYYSNAELTSEVIQHTLDYHKKISSALNLNALVGYEYQKFVYRGSGMTGKDFTNQSNVDFTNIMQNSGSAGRNIYSWYDPTSELQSYFGRLVLNYKDRYLVTGTIRADGSSKFGSNNKYGYFPSGAFAWNIHNEKFMQGNHAFSSLKVRASYGITGNSSFPPGSAQSQYSFGQQSIALSNVANPDLKWESTKQFDLGLDFELAGGRVFGNIDYFNRNTTNILFNFDAIQPAPATKYWVNLPGNVKNNGVELSLGFAIIKKQDLQWNLTGNVAFLTNVLENYNGPAVLTGAISGQGLSGASVQRLESGHPLNAFYMKQFLGLDQTGNSTFADNGNTLYYIGDPNPHQLYGISTDLTYKKWSFVANLNGAAGHNIYNNTLNALIPIGNLGSRNVATSLIGGAIKESLANPITTSTRYLEKGDYLKLANLSASYNVGNVGVIKNLRLFLTASNLFIITKYSGFDPEVNTDKNVGGVPSLGIEYIPYPSAKSFNFGLNFSL